MSEITENDLMYLNLIPLRALVVFPGMTLHFDVGRRKSVAALKNAMSTNQRIFLVCQKDSAVDEPTEDELYDTGVFCVIKQLLRIPNSENIRVVVEGVQRAQIVSFTQTKPFVCAAVELLEDEHSSDTDREYALARVLRREFEAYSKYVSKLSSDVIAKALSIRSAGALTDYVCSNTFIDYEKKQDILELNNVERRTFQLLAYLKAENRMLAIEDEINEKVSQAIEKNQREYYLREEMKIISDELGDSDNPLEEADEYRAKIDALKCGDEVKQKLYSECDKLMKMPSGSHEATVCRNYLDRCLEIPFGKFSKYSVNLKKSRAVLDKDHYGLDKVKERVVDSLAVYKRNPDFSGQILCLSGPPGVGKTSIVKSLARSMNREYVRIALGGIHDEAEIRGHRRTYIGAMPGRIVDAVIKSGVMNPIILLDEIDKLGSDYKGDPSSALLEALDPEQNNTFTDHYIDFPVDLSKVLFITTANVPSAIPAPLFDRMEVIELNSYTVDEKFHIAKEHLVKKQLAKHMLTGRELRITDGALYDIIENYTREAGVRNLEKSIASLCRKACVELDSGAKSVRITGKDLPEYLGPRKYTQDRISAENRVGVVNGLAWTSVGGTLLPIEVSALDGTGKLELTGNLGDVMQESAKTEISYVRSISNSLGIEKDFYKNKDIHIHAPEGAVPKDGPSAGLAITTAIVSELTGIPVRSNVAMTGEISLKGRAMEIGGLKEKSMAAYKAGCDTVIIPEENYKDLSEISDEVKTGVTFKCVKSFNDVMSVALEKSPLKTASKVIIDSAEADSLSVTQ